MRHRWVFVLAYFPQFPGSSPDNVLAINFKTALVALRLGDSHFSFIAPRALVGVQEQLALLAHRDAAIWAGRILQFEVPTLPTVRATIMGKHLDAVFNDIPLRRRVTPGAKRFFPMKGGQPRGQQRNRAFTIFVKHVHDDVHGSDSSFADELAKFGNQAMKLRGVELLVGKL